MHDYGFDNPYMTPMKYMGAACMSVVIIYMGALPAASVAFYICFYTPFMQTLINPAAFLPAALKSFA